MQFRKKPVVIEATRFPVEVPEQNTPEYTKAISELAAWCGGEFTPDLAGMFMPRIQIRTLEGVMSACPGDWIIKGVAGEFYPCKETIFMESYDAADAAPAQYSLGGYAGPGPGAVDAIAATKTWRRDLDAVLQSIKFHGTGVSKERAITIRKVTEGIMWLGMDLKERTEPNPYPESYNPASPKVEPTSGGLKL